MSMAVWECVGDRVVYLQSLPTCGTGPSALARSTLLIKRVIAKMLTRHHFVVCAVGLCRVGRSVVSTVGMVEIGSLQVELQCDM